MYSKMSYHLLVLVGVAALLAGVAALLAGVAALLAGVVCTVFVG